MAKQRSMYGKDDLYVTDRSNPNATRVTDVQKWRTNQDDIRHLPGALPMQKLAIQDGAISPSAAFIVVDTEGGAPADDLTAINPGDLHDGMEIELISADSSRVVTIKNSTAFSGIRTIRGEDIVLGMSYAFRLKLVSTESVTYWQELPAAVKISDSVNLEDSTTAASAKAVKIAYDKAEAALPKTGGDISGQLKINGNYVAQAGTNTKFNRSGYASSPPLVWGGTLDDLNNYNLYFTDQLRVYGANRAGSLCHSGNLDNEKITTFVWDAAIETSYIAAFNNDGSKLHPTSSDSLSVYRALALSGCVARLAGQDIGFTGTWMVIYVDNNFNIGTSVIDGGSIPYTENKNYVAIRIQ